MDPALFGKPWKGFEYTRFSKAVYLPPVIDLGIGVYLAYNYWGQYTDVYDPLFNIYRNPWGAAYWTMMVLAFSFIFLYSLVYIAQPSDTSFLRIVLSYAVADIVNAFQVSFAYFWMIKDDA